ncbi:MAG TPA: hypothetical protein ENJ35_00270, partial [Gammaproteobacteria bacterium]|nr:hypothetical protein [Gammaproteobacteria bacterium]
MSNLSKIQQHYSRLGLGDLPPEATVTAFRRAGLLPGTKSLATPLETANRQAGHLSGINSERGYRPTPENRMLYLTRQMWVDPTVRAAILDIREMDR